MVKDKGIDPKEVMKESKRFFSAIGLPKELQEDESKGSIFPVSLVEMGVMNYPDPRMEGWRLYRIEYGGHAMDCVCEGMIWLPPNVNPDRIEYVLNEGQDFKFKE